MINKSSFLFLLALGGLSGCAVAQPQGAPGANAPLITGFDKAPLFAYGSWDGKARVDGGVFNLQIADNRGGLGDNLDSDFSTFSEFSPQLTLRINDGNQAKNLRLALRDDAGKSATWNFSLEGAAKNQTITLLPREGAALGDANENGKEGAPNLGKIRQWQVQGDWGGEPLDVALDSVSLVAPTPEIVALRQARVQRLAKEAEDLRKERADLQAKYPRGPLSPRVTQFAPVAPDVLAVSIEQGRVIPAKLERYTPQPGDEKHERKNGAGEVTEIELRRGGKAIGFLNAPKYEWLTTHEGYEGDPLLDWFAQDAQSYTLSSPDDADLNGAKPIQVARKSTPIDWAQGPGILPIRHTFYLKLPRALQSGKKYSLNFGPINTNKADVSFVNDAAKVRSEAVRVNQIGYRADDPAKRAFVSCWMGTGGSLKLPDTLKFSLVDDKTGKVVFSGQSKDIWRAEKTEKMARDANFSGTDVARLDFSNFKTPGKYRVAVEGFGSSFPFEIGPNVWRQAFWTQMKGLYNQRTGMELGPPYTNFKKPRDMNPKDGYDVTRTTYRAIEKGNEAFSDIVAGDTGEKVNGWGGYHDAGDWNPRRVTHMKITYAQLEMLELFPAYFGAMKLNIPAQKGIPDILTEAQWEFDTFLRLQTKDGGVGMGLESKGDPREGEVSWLNSFKSYAFAPDYNASWYYAAIGAKLSRSLAPFDAKRAKVYRDSAIKAFQFAEADFARDKASGQLEKNRETWQAIDNRNLAALELYRLTGEKKYHDAFAQDTVLKDAKPDLFVWGKAVQRDAAFLYARLPANLGNPAWKKKATAALEAMANRSLDYAANNAWNLTSPDPGKPQFLTFYSVPDATDLTRAHFLTKNPKYLAGAVQATQFQSGANPNNLVYIQGLGANPVKNTFKLDARRTGQKAPIGLVPYGNIDLPKWGEQGWINWPITWFTGKVTVPSPYDWPTNEAYWDLGAWPALNEFTVDTWAPNVQIWGYLAARPAAK